MTRSRGLVAGAIFIFVVQLVASNFLRREPFLPSPPPLSDIPSHVGDWSEMTEESVPADALAMLGPDDVLARLYTDPRGTAQAELFVAYYKTQLRSKTAHDPKVCLPGAGWNPVESHTTRVNLPGSAASFPANYYRIKKDDHEQVVLYWFQTPRGVYTLEQQLRAHRILEAILDNRTDMALVRIVVPVTSAGVSAANANARQLAQSFYTQMLSHFPPASRSRS